MPITKRLFRSALTLTRCNVDRVRTQPTPGRLARLFARLDREPERPANPHVPVMSRHRLVLLLATLAFYLAIVVAVAATTWLVRLDWQLMFFRPYQQWPEVHAFLDYLVVLGQRGPTAVMVLAWLGWRSWRQHTLRPLLVLGASLLLLNITVGAAKIGMGRLGPHYATVIGSNEMGLGGDIFPSGHTANAVVDLGDSRVPGPRPPGQKVSVGGFGDRLAERRPHHRLPGHALAQRRRARLGGRAAGAPRAAVVRAAGGARRGAR
ncbi:hypothetical protein GA0115246_112142, partial [Streptomyces sp. SolWspMP-sol7th]